MSTQKAIEIKGRGDAQLVTNRPIPRLRDDYLLIKTSAVALNPSDWKHVDFMATPSALLGCDYSGTVLAIGPAVKKQFKIGDRVCGMCHGANMLEHEDGAFAEVIAAKGDVQMKVPEGMGMEEASALGVGVVTVGLGLFQSLQLPLPDTEEAKEKGGFVLIYGGSTATGTMAIQFARL